MAVGPQAGAAPAGLPVAVRWSVAAAKTSQQTWLSERGRVDDEKRWQRLRRRGSRGRASVLRAPYLPIMMILADRWGPVRWCWIRQGRVADPAVTVVTPSPAVLLLCSACPLPLVPTASCTKQSCPVILSGSRSRLLEDLLFGRYFWINVSAFPPYSRSVFSRIWKDLGDVWHLCSQNRPFSRPCSASDDLSVFCRCRSSGVPGQKRMPGLLVSITVSRLRASPISNRTQRMEHMPDDTSTIRLMSPVLLTLRNTIHPSPVAESHCHWAGTLLQLRGTTATNATIAL